MMEMKSTLMRRVWEIGNGFKHSVEDVESGLVDILNLDPNAELLAMIRDTVTLGGESLFTIKNKDTKELEAEIKIEKIAEETDVFGDLVPAHMKITYLNHAE